MLTWPSNKVLCCLGGYWNCLEECCSETKRQTGRNHIFLFRELPLCHMKLEDVFIVKYRKDSYFSHLNGKIWLWYSKSFCQFHCMLEHDIRSLFSSISNTEQTDKHQGPLNNSDPYPVISHLLMEDKHITGYCCYLWERQILKWSSCLSWLRDLFVVRFDIEIFLIWRVGISL